VRIAYCVSGGRGKIAKKGKSKKAKGKREKEWNLEKAEKNCHGEFAYLNFAK